MYTKIKSFEDACTKLGISTQLPDVSMLREANQKAVIANYKLDIIQEAINADWTADWNNYNQCKYCPWFGLSRSGVGFSCYGCVFVASLSDVGSRRVFPSREIAKYVGQQFIDLYNDAMFIQPNL
ncbi:MAG TPA: hypothetical protein PLP27_05555 [Crocinitomicaceae bacterium]|nr:hypothetical protein [Crocinitomicaceae bacterium]